MTSGPADIVGGLEARLKTIPKFRTIDHIPDQIKVGDGTGFVALPDIDYLAAMGSGVTTWDYRIVVMVSKTVTRAAQLALMEFADPFGPRSIRAAVMADRTLGLPDVDAHVKRFDPFGVDEIGLYSYFGGTFTVPIVLTKGTA